MMTGIINASITAILNLGGAYAPAPKIAAFILALTLGGTYFVPINALRSHRGTYKVEPWCL